MADDVLVAIWVTAMVAYGTWRAVGRQIRCRCPDPRPDLEGEFCKRCGRPAREYVCKIRGRW